MTEPIAAGGPAAALRDLLRRPARLGLALNAALLASWYGAAYMPLHRAIGREGGRLAAERDRLALAREVAHLRRQADGFAGHLPAPAETDAGADPWVPFLMAAVRQFPIKLVSLEPRPPIDVGPYKATVHRVVIEGPFPELERFLRWLEGAPRLIRVDSIHVVTKPLAGAAPGATTNEMQLMVLGVEG